MDIIVQKYGGTSVGDVKRIKRVARRILSSHQRGTFLVVVVSAMGQATDRLIRLTRAITANPSQREMDMLLSTGEQVSIALLSMALHELGVAAVSMTGMQSGIITDNRYSMAKIKGVKSAPLLSQLKLGKVVIVAGFQGVGSGKQITTLGRGGSDTSATALAVALGARCCEIYTDVDGVFTTDPSMVPGARKLDFISYEEMVELAGAGASVLHPRSVEIAMKYQVPLVVLPSYTEGGGTVVTEGKKLEKVVITGMTANRNIAKVGIRGIPDRPGIAARVFSALGRHGINIRLIIQSMAEDGRNDISLVVNQEYVKSAVEVLQKQKSLLRAKEIVHQTHFAEVSIVGSGIASTPGVGARMFRTLAKEKINIELISSSEVRITCVIEERKAVTALRALHKEFRLEKLQRRIRG